MIVKPFRKNENKNNIFFRLLNPRIKFIADLTYRTWHHFEFVISKKKKQTREKNIFILDFNIIHAI